MEHYTISAVKHNLTFIKGVQNLGLNPALQQIISSGSGAVDPTFSSVGQLQPEMTFDASAIKTALANLGGIDGIALNNFIFWFQKMVAGGKRASGLAHTKVTAASGIIIPTRIDAPKLPGEATISYRIVPVSADGDASPLAIAADQALEAGQDQISEAYVTGPIVINGVALDGVESWTLDFGITLEIVNVHIYPTFVGIMSRAPFFTARTFDIDTFESWDIDGVAQGASNSTIQLLDQVEGGARGSSPITFIIDAGMVHFESLDGRHGQRFGGSVRITPTSDGVADIIAISGIS